MEKTANTDVEVEEVKTDSTDVAESSPAKDQNQEIDFESMSQDDLIEFAKNEHEAKKRVIGHLRDKLLKSRPNLEAIDQAPTGDQAPIVEIPDDLDARIAKAVEEKLQEKQGDYAKGSTEWLFKQPWAAPFLPETPGSDPLYAKLFTEVKRLRETRPVTTAAEYQQLMKLAAVNVTGTPDALLQEAPAESDTVRYRKSMATSPSVSAGTPTKRHFTKEEIAFALSCGHKPEDVYKD